MDRKEETKAVKALLQSMGYRKITVGHGKGTAWGWLELAVTSDKPADCYCALLLSSGGGRCAKCVNEYSNHRLEIQKKIHALTGRCGEYGGNTLIDVHLEKIENYVDPCGYQTTPGTCSKPGVSGHQPIDCAHCNTGTAQAVAARKEVQTP